MITDRTRIARKDPGHTDICEVPWPLYQVINPEISPQVKIECESAAIGCVQCKERLGNSINEFFGPMRERRLKLASDPDQVTKILKYGNQKARKVARQTLKDVREIMGMVSWADS
jgi:tryptophanyl-tRNA synthetase